MEKGQVETSKNAKQADSTTTGTGSTRKTAERHEAATQQQRAVSGQQAPKKNGDHTHMPYRRGTKRGKSTVD